MCSNLLNLEGNPAFACLEVRFVFDCVCDRDCFGEKNVGLHFYEINVDGCHTTLQAQNNNHEPWLHGALSVSQSRTLPS